MYELHPLAILEGEVFALTHHGETELGGGGTTLSPDELRILILIDGKATVGQTLVRARDHGIANELVLERLRKFKGAGMIKLVDPADTALDFVDFFNVKGQLSPSNASVAEAKKSEAETALLLQQQGYVVRIVRRPDTLSRAVDQPAPKILVIEDSPSVLKLLKFVLESEGFTVATAMNAVEIMEQLRTGPLPDLVLLDVVLPDVDGFHVLNRIRHHPVLKSLPVMMLTSMSTREAVLKGLEGGANGYITKPFDIEVLIKAVRVALGLPAKTSQDTVADVWARQRL